MRYWLTSILIIGLLGGGSSLSAQNMTGPDFDIEFVQFQLDDTSRLFNTATFSGYLKNNGPNRYRGSIELDFLVTDTIMNQAQAGSYSKFIPSFSTTFNNLDIPVGDSTYVTTDVFVDTTHFRAMADHGTLIWPVYYSDSTGMDTDTTNNYHIDSIYILSADTQSAKGEDNNNVSGRQMTNSNPLSLYPNPTHGVLRVRLAQPSPGKATLQLYDLNGKRVYQKELPGRTSELLLNMKQITPSPSNGIYHLVYQRGDQRVVKRVMYLD